MRYKLTNYALPLLGMLMVACSSEDAIDETSTVVSTGVQKEDVIFSANISSDIVSRTQYDGSGTKTVWTTGDKIRIFNSTKTDSKIFALVGEGGTKDGQFKQDKNIEGNGESLQLDEGDAVYAFYPSDKGTVSGTSVSASVPSAQSEANAATPFTTGYSYMLAKADANNNLAFKNVISFIKVTVTPSTNFPISKVKVVANTADNSVKLAGTFNTSITDGVTSVSNIKNGSTFVEVNGENLSGTYYLAVLPTAAAVPLTLLIEDVNGNKAYQRVNSGLNIAAGQIYDFGAYTAADNNGVTKVTASFGNSTSPVLNDVVDLGLPSGTLWCLNDVVRDGDVEATKGFYAWGEVQSKAASMYDWNYTSSTPNYKHGVGVDRIPVVEMFNQTISDNFIRVSNILIGGNAVNGAAGTLKKYNSQSGYTHTIFDWFGSGVQDKLIELKPEDDAAYQSNNLLITPLMDQAKELVTYTTASGYSRISKVAGYTTRSVTFAATGFMRDGTSTFANKDNTKNYNGTAPYKYSNDANTGYYWTKTRAHTSDGQGEYVIINGERKRSDFMAKSLEITSGDAFVKRADRCEGRKVRPVVRNTNIKAVAVEDHFD